LYEFVAEFEEITTKAERKFALAANLARMKAEMKVF
jgi:hypothetical protein